jgi:hypothetical protein
MVVAARWKGGGVEVGMVKDVVVVVVVVTERWKGGRVEGWR